MTAKEEGMESLTAKEVSEPVTGESKPPTTVGEECSSNAGRGDETPGSLTSSGMESLIRCPGCDGGPCPCRGGGEQLLLDDVGSGEAAAPASELGEAGPGPNLRLVEPPPPRERARLVLWSLTGGPCAGEYEAYSSWPPPETIRAVVDREGTTAVLDLAEDEVEPGEELVIYRRWSHGFMCGPKTRSGKQTPLTAHYFPESFSDRERTLAMRAELSNLHGAK